MYFVQLLLTSVNLYCVQYSVSTVLKWTRTTAQHVLVTKFSWWVYANYTGGVHIMKQWTYVFRCISVFSRYVIYYILYIALWDYEHSLNITFDLIATGETANIIILRPCFLF